MTDHPDNSATVHPRALLIGGQGLIGRNLAPMLAGQGYEVLATGLRRSDPFPGPAIKTTTLDARDFAATRSLFQEFQPSLVVSLVAHRHHRDIKGTLSVHKEGAESLVSAMNATPQVRRCLHFSTELVKYLSITDPQALRDPGVAHGRRYATCHYAAEQALRERIRDDIAWTIVRPVSVWGPHFSVPFRGFFERIAQRRYWDIGGASPLRYMSYVGNLVYQIRQLLIAPQSFTRGQTFVCADYEPFTVRQWAEAIAREYGLPAPPTLPGALVTAAARAGDLLALLGMRDPPLTTRRVSNMRKAGGPCEIDAIRRIAPDLPYNLRAGVAATIAWLRTQGIHPHHEKSVSLSPQPQGSPPCASA